MCHRLCRFRPRPVGVHVVAASVKTVAIVQSSYLPWIGYFDLIRRCDEFLFLEDVQYTKRDWRNRNYFKFATGHGRLTVPVMRGARSLTIDRVLCAEDWASRHWKSLSQAYAAAPYFAVYEPLFEAVYRDPPALLSEVNRALIDVVCRLLGLPTLLRCASEYGRFTGRTSRLVSLCGAAGATVYLTGPKARGYLDVGAFDAAGVAVEFMEYPDYGEYPQLHGPFIDRLSVVDALFNVGARGVMGLMEREGIAV